MNLIDVVFFFLKYYLEKYEPYKNKNNYLKSLKKE